MKKDVKTTVIALLNIIIVIVLLVIWYLDQITTEDLTLAIAGVTSALASVIGFLSADSKETES